MNIFWDGRYKIHDFIETNKQWTKINKFYLYHIFNNWIYDALYSSILKNHKITLLPFFPNFSLILSSFLTSFSFIH